MEPPTGAPGSPTRADAGHRIYTSRFLKVYDLVVLRLYSNVVWRCPPRRLVTLYSENLRPRHLDVGPGTGYFLAKARRPASFTLTLADASRDVLQHASQRLAHLNPTAVEADVREPLPVPATFGSVGLSYVLHCLPGPQAAKAAAVRHVADVLNTDGVLFGATILGDPQRHTALSRAAMRDLNRKGVFDNAGDTEKGLRAILEESFDEVAIDMVGAVAVFAAMSPHRSEHSAARPRELEAVRT